RSGRPGPREQPRGLGFIVKLERFAQPAARAEQPHARRARVDLEDLAERVDAELLPVVELEQRLLLDGKLAQRLDHARAIGLPRQPAARRRDDLCDRDRREVEALALALLRAQVVP